MRCAANGMGISTEMGSSSATSAFLANERRVCPFGGAHACGVGEERVQSRSVAIGRAAWEGADASRCAEARSRGTATPERAIAGKYLAKRRFGRSASRSPADAPAARRRRGRRTCWTRTSARQRGEACPRSWRTWHRLCASARVACGASESNAREKRVFRKSAFGLCRASSGSPACARRRRKSREALSVRPSRICYLFHDARLRPRRFRARARPPSSLPSARRARCPRWPRCRPRRTSSRSGRATCP